MTTLVVRQTAAFRRDVRRLARQRVDLSMLESIVELLVAKKPLAPGHRDHPLSGDWKGFRDCHVRPDWVLIYRGRGQ